MEIKHKMEAIRVNAKYIEQFPNRTVKVIGKLENFDASSKTGVLQSNGVVNLKFPANSPSYTKGKWYEFVATIDGTDSSLKVIEGVDMGDELNEKAVNKMVDLCHKFPELFYDKSVSA